MKFAAKWDALLKIWAKVDPWSPARDYNGSGLDRTSFTRPTTGGAGVHSGSPIQTGSVIWLRKLLSN